MSLCKAAVIDSEEVTLSHLQTHFDAIAAVMSNYSFSHNVFNFKQLSYLLYFYLFYWNCPGFSHHVFNIVMNYLFNTRNDKTNVLSEDKNKHGNDSNGGFV